MTVRVVPLTSRDAGDPRMGGTVNERVAAVAVLTAAAWAASGKPLPTYTRAMIPVAVTTLAEQSDSLSGR